MLNSIQKSDLTLKTEVLSELKKEPNVQVTDIGVLVKDGTITLNGYVESYDEKWSAIESARRVEGSNEIADDIEVQLPESTHHTDGDIAAAAAKKIDESTFIIEGSVRLMVSQGWVTLEGEVQWIHQRTSAEECVQKLVGVRGISNLITIRPDVTVSQIEASIISAFGECLLLRDAGLQIEVLGTSVVLMGRVEKWLVRTEAERVALSVPGIFSVDNRIDVTDDNH